MSRREYKIDFDEYKTDFDEYKAYIHEYIEMISFSYIHEYKAYIHEYNFHEYNMVGPGYQPPVTATR